MQQNKLYVGNLPYTVDDAQLRALFGQYGEIQELALIMDRDTGRPKGFAFITFATQQAAESALAQNDKDFDGRPMKVNMAEERKSGGRGRGRGRGGSGFGGGGGGGFGGGGGGFGGSRSRW
jgi:cold-inducible RNA-binding protein